MSVLDRYHFDKPVPVLTREGGDVDGRQRIGRLDP